MKNPKLIDLKILRALSYKNGDVSYLKDVLARADMGSVRGLPTLHWKDMTRKDVWNSTKSLIDKGLISRKEEKFEATARDKVTYVITEKGRQYLTVCEYTLISETLTSA